MSNIKDAEIKLIPLVQRLAANNETKKAVTKIIDADKEIVKSIFEEFSIDQFSDATSGHKVSMTTVDKSYLNPDATIEYLKAAGLTKYIHTKEYIDDVELTMGILNGELDAKELYKFKIDKTETRFNIK